jgi:hypothetical protein
MVRIEVPVSYAVLENVLMLVKGKGILNLLLDEGDKEKYGIMCLHSHIL